MRRFVASSICAVMACVLAAATGGAWAQGALSDSAKKMVGSWEFSNADRDKICILNLKSDPAGKVLQLEFDKGCAALFPFTRNVAGWTFAENDFLRLLDTHGKSLAEFSEVEDGIFEAPTPGEGILFIQNAAAAGPPPRTPEQMMGEWTLMRGGKPICDVTLSNTAAGEAYALKINPGCDPAVVRFAPTAWNMDREELLIVSARGVWRFDLGDNEVWDRVPETADGMTLKRK